MKKSLLILLLFSTLDIRAQITLNSSNVPPIGTNYTTVRHNNSSLPGLIISAGGPSQTWNYSSGWILNDTSFNAVVSPSGLPQSNLYPNSNLVFVNTSDPANPSYGYATSTATGIRVDGFYSLSSFGTYRANYEGYTFLDLPMTYGSVFNYSGKISLVFIGSTIAQKVISRETGTKTIDAWGSLTTPKTTYPSVLRMKQEILTKVDSTFIDATGSGNFVFSSTNSSLPTTNDYKFYANLPFPEVLTLRANKATGQITYNTYLDNTIVAAVNETELNKRPAGSFYPNPASGMLHFSKTSPLVSKMELVNLSGQVVFTYGMADLDQLSIATERFANGFYTWRLLNAEGAVLQAGKVLVKN